MPIVPDMIGIVVRDVPRPRQDKRVSPEARERGLEPRPHFPSACFAHGPAGVGSRLYRARRRNVLRARR